jgi:hypothetical protein
MRFNIFFTLTGPSGRIIEAPNTNNPVECANLAGLLSLLSTNLPGSYGTETIGIRVERVPDVQGA